MVSGLLLHNVSHFTTRTSNEKCECSHVEVVQINVPSHLRPNTGLFIFDI